MGSFGFGWRIGARAAASAAARMVAAAIMLIAASAAPAQSTPAHRHGAMGGGAPRPGLAASAAFDAQGTLWAVQVEDNHVVVRKSTSFGADWSPPTRVNAVPEQVESDGDSKPSIAVGGNGDIYVSWTRPLAKPYTGEIRFSRSLDGGKSFSPPRRVHADPKEAGHRFDALTTTPDGHVLVAWIDKRDPAAALYYAVSDDRGATFRGDYKAFDHSCECCRISLVPRKDGSVLAFWRHVFDPNIRDHALGTLGIDGKTTGLRRVTFDDWRIDACPHHGGTLGVDARDRLHAVWYSGAPGHSGVYYGQLGSEGPLGQRRIGGETAEHADLAVSGEKVAIVWKEFDGEHSQLRASLSADGGASFTDRDVASTSDASDQPRVLSYGGRFYVFWNTRAEPRKVVALP